MAFDPQQRLYYFNVPQYTHEQIAQLRSQFAAADRDRNGRLDKKEFKKFLGKGSKAGLKGAFAVFDKDRSGSLSFDEYVEYLGFVALARTDPRSYFTRLFAAFDYDGNGQISIKDLDHLLKAAGIDKKDVPKITTAAGHRGTIGLQDLFALIRI